MAERTFEKLPALVRRLEKVESQVVALEARTRAAIESLQRDVGAFKAQGLDAEIDAMKAELQGLRGGPWGDEAAASPPDTLAPDAILAGLAQHGVRDIYADVFGDWKGHWSPWDEPGWLYEDGYHFNVQGQADVRRRFQKWLREEEARVGRFDVLISDSVFLTHDDSCPNGRVEEDKEDFKQMGFSSVYMRCGVGFVRNGGFARMLEEGLWSGELIVRSDSRVLLVTSGNDVWCCPYTQPLYSDDWLGAHIRWARDVLNRITPHVVMVSLIDSYRDWLAE